MLTRDDLESNRLRRLFCQAHPEAKVLSDTEQEASLSAALASRPDTGDVWLFGYGSLVWNPIVRHRERRVAMLRGFHRRFCLWSHVGRGSPAQPGLVLGLDAGGVCRGVAFRIDAAHAQDELRLLWRREMVIGSYVPRWVRLDTGADQLTALAFVVNRTHPAYAGRLPSDAILKNMLSARGYLGTPAEYLLETTRGLLEHGVRDAYLMRLRKQLLALRPALAAAHHPVPRHEPAHADGQAPAPDGHR